MAITVRDIIHHGDYYNERTVTLPDESLDTFVAFLNSGPYGAGDSVSVDNRYAQEAWHRFYLHGVSEFGWRRFVREV